MPRRQFTEEQIIEYLRQANAFLLRGDSVVEACRKVGVSKQSYYRWRKDYGGLSSNEARRLVELENENVHLRGQVSELIVKAKEERLRFEHELHQNKKMAGLGTLAGGIAHEINTPIQYIGDNLRFLREASHDLLDVLETCSQLIEHVEAKGVLVNIVAKCRTAYKRKDVDFLCHEVPQAIEQSIEGVKQVTNIVVAMNEFAHPIQREMVPVDLNRIIERSIIVCKSEWKHCADVKFNADENLPQVIGDEGVLNQVVLNLVVNAAHAISQKKEQVGQIMVETMLIEDQVRLSIEDNGIGIPEEIQPKIFKPFFTTKDVGEGTGQGLALVYEAIVNRHGGKIDVKSVVGEGTTFSIDLPTRPCHK